MSRPNLYIMYDWVVSNAIVDSQVEVENRCIAVAIAHVIEKKQVKVFASH
jgi:hypothetical protein